MPSCCEDASYLVITRISVARHIDGAVSTDSDFVAVGGAPMLLIKGWKFDSGKLQLAELSVAAGFKETIVEAFGYDVFITQPSGKTVMPAQFPIFDHMDPGDHMSRALVCVGLGCDTFPKGIKGIGPAKIEKVVKD